MSRTNSLTSRNDRLCAPVLSSHVSACFVRMDGVKDRAATRFSGLVLEAVRSDETHSDTRRRTIPPGNDSKSTIGTTKGRPIALPNHQSFPGGRGGVSGGLSTPGSGAAGGNSTGRCSGISAGPCSGASDTVMEIVISPRSPNLPGLATSIIQRATRARVASHLTATPTTTPLENTRPHRHPGRPTPTIPPDVP
jgi:hypothetical protein